jgi:hypothetical protein
MHRKPRRNIVKKIASALFLMASLAVFALPASADTYTVTFNNTGGQSTAGVYVYPYNFTVTDTTTASPATNVSMMCIDFEREIFQPETWTATLVNITAPNAGDVPPFTTNQLDILAVLDSEITAATPGTQAVSDLQFAAWEVTASTADKTTGPYAAGFTAAATADYNAAVTAVGAGTAFGATGTAGAITYSDYSYFDPTTWPSGDGDPQRFLTYTGSGSPVPHTSPVPEPSSLMLLGTGVLGIASVARRRFLKA